LDVGEHLVEGINQKAGISAGLDSGTDGVILVDGYMTCDSCQVHKRVPDGARKAQRGQECDQDGENKHDCGDLQVFQKP
jgi:hypothetical protein